MQKRSRFVITVIILSAVALSIFIVFARGKAPSVEFIKELNYYDRHVSYASDGGYVVSGRHLYKLDANGELAWKRPDYKCNSTIVTDDGGILLFSLGSLVKMTDDGKRLWDKRISARYPGRNKFVPSKHGFYEVASAYKGYVTVHLAEPRVSITSAFPLYFHEQTIEGVLAKDGGVFILGTDSRTSSNFRVVKLDKNGRTEWEKDFSKYKVYYNKSAAETEDGGLIMLIQWPEGKDDNVLSLSKLDANGSLVWEKNIHDARGRFITQTSDGGYLILGSGTRCNEYAASLVEKLMNMQSGSSFKTVYDKLITIITKLYKNTDCSSGILVIKANAKGEAEWEMTFPELGRGKALIGEETSDDEYLIFAETLTKKTVKKYMIKIK